MTHSIAKTFSNAPLRIGSWRIDPDGFLRVTARVLKEGVYPYSAEEAGFGRDLSGVDPVMEYIPRGEFTREALASLEGKPVTVPLIEPGQEWHQWRNPRNALRDCLTVGTIAGRPVVTDDGGIACDMLIMDPEAIRAITGRGGTGQRLVEVSAGYDGSLAVEAGSFNGQPYHAVQRDLRFNHILLLPEGMGRCGHEVRIINARQPMSFEWDRSVFAPLPGPFRGPSGKNRSNREEHPPINRQPEGEKIMPTTIKATVGNKRRSYTFQNEEDAARAEEMLHEERDCHTEALQAAMDEIVALKEQLAEQAALLEEAEKRVEDLLSPESQEALAQEMVEQQTAEEAIIDAETGNMGGSGEQEEREAFRAVLSNCGSLAERRAAVVSRVMHMRGLATGAHWTREAYDGAFEMLAATAQARSGRILNGRRTPGKGAAASLGNRERMLRPMKARNAETNRIG